MAGSSRLARRRAFPEAAHGLVRPHQTAAPEGDHRVELCSPVKRRSNMSRESRLIAGLLLLILPTVMLGGVSILTLLIGTPEYMANKLRQDLWRAGHAHAGVFLILALIALRYVDEATLSTGAKRFVRSAIPSAAILIPFAFFFSVLTPDATQPNALIGVAYLGAIVLAAGAVTLGVGLLRRQIV